MIFRMNKIFEIEDEVTEDSVEQIEAKQFPCDECEYDAKKLTTWKGTNSLDTKHNNTHVMNVSIM